MATIRFITEKLEVEVNPPLSLEELCQEVDCDITFGCRSGTCGTCRVRVEKGEANVSPMQPEERDFLAGFGAAPRERLGCQLTLLGDVDLTYVGLDDLGP